MDVSLSLSENIENVRISKYTNIVVQYTVYSTVHGTEENISSSVNMRALWHSLTQQLRAVTLLCGEG